LVSFAFASLTTPPRKARIILITLLIGFLSGATATAYVLLRYGYLIGFQRFSQTGQSSRQTPGRIPQASVSTAAERIGRKSDSRNDATDGNANADVVRRRDLTLPGDMGRDLPQVQKRIPPR